MLWMDENTNGIHATNGLEDSKHTANNMRYDVFPFILLELGT